jgi:uncharacterized protein
VTEKVKMILAELRARLEQHYGPRLAGLYLFGSQARGDAEEDSDIDVLVVLRGETNPFLEITETSDIAAGISLEWNVVISRIFVSEDRYAKEQSSFFVNARREGVAV